MRRGGDWFAGEEERPVLREGEIDMAVYMIVEAKEVMDKDKYGEYIKKVKVTDG